MFVSAGKDSPGSESDGGDSRSDTGSGEIQPKKVIRSQTLNYVEWFLTLLRPPLSKPRKPAEKTHIAFMHLSLTLFKKRSTQTKTPVKQANQQ